MNSHFPPFIEACPAPDAPVPMRAHIVPSEHVLTMFYEIDDEVVVPAHRHGAQWGVVLDGSMELTIDGIATSYSRGDTYYIPAETTHVANIHAGYRGIDVFADARRYEPRSTP